MLGWQNSINILLSEYCTNQYPSSITKTNVPVIFGKTTEYDHMKPTKPASIDAYIEGFPKEIQDILEEIRATVKKAAPNATETIKYDMPTFVQNGNLVHFAAFKKHIGFYPAPTGDKAFEEALKGYKTGKGSIQFPLDKPMPLELITRLVKLRVEDMGKKVR